MERLSRFHAPPANAYKTCEHTQSRSSPCKGERNTHSHRELRQRDNVAALDLGESRNSNGSRGADKGQVRNGCASKPSAEPSASARHEPS